MLRSFFATSPKGTVTGRPLLITSGLGPDLHLKPSRWTNVSKAGRIPSGRYGYWGRSGYDSLLWTDRNAPSQIDLDEGVFSLLNVPAPSFVHELRIVRGYERGRRRRLALRRRRVSYPNRPALINIHGHRLNTRPHKITFCQSVLDSQGLRYRHGPAVAQVLLEEVRGWNKRAPTPWV